MMKKRESEDTKLTYLLCCLHASHLSGKFSGKALRSLVLGQQWREILYEKICMAQ